MNVSEFTLTLLLVFLPGIMAMVLINYFTNSKIYDMKHFLLYAYLLSLFSYMIAGVFQRQSLIGTLTAADTPIESNQIIGATLVGGVLAVLLIYAITHKWFYKIASKLNITKKYGSGDVWTSIMEDSTVRWVNVRPGNGENSFQGEVLHYSDDGQDRELALCDVAIYDNKSGDYLYTQEKIYLSFTNDTDIVIEIGVSSQDKGRNGGEDIDK